MNQWDGVFGAYSYTAWQGRLSVLMPDGAGLVPFLLPGVAVPVLLPGGARTKDGGSWS